MFGLERRLNLATLCDEEQHLRLGLTSSCSVLWRNAGHRHSTVEFVLRPEREFHIVWNYSFNWNSGTSGVHPVELEDERILKVLWQSLAIRVAPSPECFRGLNE